MPPRDEGLPNGLQAAGLVLALMLAEYVIGAALYDARGWLGLSLHQLDAMVALLGNAVVFTLVMHYRHWTYGALFHSARSSPGAMLLLVPPIVMSLPLLLLGVSALVGVVLQLAPLSAQEEAMFEHMADSNLAALVTVCVLAPVLEEMLFRGIVLRSFLIHYPRRVAIAGSAILFGVAHLNIYQFCAALVLGTFAGWLYERTRSLIPCIALHASYNTSLAVLSYIGRQGDFTEEPGAVAWGVALVLGAGSLWMLRRLLLPRRPAPPLG